LANGRKVDASLFEEDNQQFEFQAPTGPAGDEDSGHLTDLESDADMDRHGRPRSRALMTVLTLKVPLNLLWICQINMTATTTTTTTICEGALALERHPPATPMIIRYQTVSGTPKFKLWLITGLDLHQFS